MFPKANLFSKIFKHARKAQYFKEYWDINSTFSELPITNKDIFKKSNRDKVLAVDPANLTHYYFSGGTTGNPKAIPLTQAEVDARSSYRRDCYKLVGINEQDRVAVMLPFGPWVAGQSAQDALMLLGCKVFPLGMANSHEELLPLLKVIVKHRINIIVSTPSFVDFFCEVLKSSAHKVGIEKVVTSGEYAPSSLRDKVKNVLGAELYSSYASSESFIGIECSYHSGYHFNPDKVYIETIKETGSRTKGNQDCGLTVITVWDSEAIPIIRYEIGDIAYLDNNACLCGSELPRVILKGRKAGIFEVAGAVNVSSNQILDALSNVNLEIIECTITLENKDVGSDRLIVEVIASDRDSEVDIKNSKNSIIESIKEMSLDFSDVVHHGLVEVSVDIEFRQNSHAAVKTNLKIIDDREYER